MGKGEVTKQAILEHASSLASRVGFEGLTIGKLAEELQLSKSGLYAHFRSKEALEVQVLEHAEARFIEAVVKPALTAPRGEKRVRALYDRWMRWPKTSGLAGGCCFIAVGAELDDRPGPARDVLVRQQKDWMDVIANVVRTAIAEGDFKKNVDPEQFAYELWGILLAYHWAVRLIEDPKAQARANAAFEALMTKAEK